MSWIDEYSKATFHVFSGQVLAGFQPLDFFHFFPLWYDLWIHDIAEALKKINAQEKSYKEMQDILPTVSNMRAILIKVIPCYMGVKNPDDKEFAYVCNFFARMIKEACPADSFAESKSQIHSEKELQVLLPSILFHTASVDEARLIGQLITAAGSLVHGLYNDVVTDYGWDAYGPYTIKEHNEKRTFLIRDFPDLSPTALWEKKLLPNITSLKIYSTYTQETEWFIRSVGCHTMSTGESPVRSMREWAVEADGVFLKKEDVKILIDVLSKKAELIYKKIRGKDFEMLKQMALEQELYQTHRLMQAAGMNAKPSKEMLGRIQGKELMTNLFPLDELMETQEQFQKVFGINSFKEKVLQ